MREPNPRSQPHDLLCYLRKHRAKGITSYEADTKLGIMRLSERVRDLEELGVKIDRRPETKIGRHRKVRFVRYWLAAKQA